MTHSCIRVQEPLAHKMEMVVRRLLVKCKLVISWCNGQKGRELFSILNPSVPHFITCVGFVILTTRT